MRVDRRIIVRKEDRGWLLYNGDNGGLICVRDDIYLRYFLADGSSQESWYLQLRQWLAINGFLSATSGEKNRVGIEEPCSVEEDRFSELRSNRNPLNVLWALTPRCNLRCIYCFADVRSHAPRFKGRTLEELLHVAENLIRAKVLRVTLSGGECLLVREIWAIIERLRAAGLTVAAITNGTTVSEATAGKLASSGVRVGVSLDGPTEEVNRTTRGAGAFEKTVRGIRRLLEAGVPTAVLVTLTRHNFPVLYEHFMFLRSLGVRFVTLQDLRPFGSREVYNATRLTAQQEAGLQEVFAAIQAVHPQILINPTELFIFSRASTTGKVMQCPAGENFAYIDFNGDVFPCTSLPTFCMGNLFGGASLTELWRFSESARRLQEIKAMSLDRIPGCQGCPNSRHCDGGCRGDALFMGNGLLGIPSRCPRSLGVLEATAHEGLRFSGN